MAASRHAARPGDARSATLFLGDALPKYIRWAFPYPRPNIHMAGRTLPYPYLSASPDPLPRGSRGALVHPNGVYLHDPQSRVKTAQAKGVGGHGALVHPNGVYLHDLQSRVKTAQAKGVRGHGDLVHPNGVYLHDPQSRVKTAQAKGVGGMVPP